MNSNIKPSIIVRNFRGHRLYLKGTDVGRAYLWTREWGNAQRFATPQAALAVARQAAKEYGADCVVMDPSECALQPVQARGNKS